MSAVFSCLPTTAYSDSLVSEVKEKTEKISKSLSVIAKHLNWAVEPGTCSVKGLVITTSSKKETELITQEQVDILFRNELLDACRSHGIERSEIERLFPNRYVPEFKEMSTSDLWDLLHRDDDQ